MRNSNYARLINAEPVYKEKIRQLEAENEQLRATIREYEVWTDPEIIDAEIVQVQDRPWTMFHDPDGNEYDK